MTTDVPLKTLNKFTRGNSKGTVKSEIIHSSQVDDQASISICVNSTAFFLTTEGTDISGDMTCAVQALPTEF